MRARKLLSRPVIIAIVIAAIAGTFSVSQLGGPAGAAEPDKIVYGQQTGANGTYLQYVPGDGSAATKQAVTSGGGCATPSVSGTPLLGFGGKYYANGYTNASTDVSRGRVQGTHRRVLDPAGVVGRGERGPRLLRR